MIGKNLRSYINNFEWASKIAWSKLTGKQTFWKEKATLAIEVSGICNLRCQMCSYPSSNRKKGFMEWNLFEKIVNDAAKNGHDIASLHFFGEPLLWPHIVEGIELLSKKGLYPRISTNGMLLTGELAYKLQSAGLKEIMVTIDTLIPEAYPNIRAGGKLSVVIKNIHDAIAAAPNMQISAQLMPTKYNPRETEKDFYEEFGRHNNFKVQQWFVIRMANSENISQDLSHKPDEVDKRLCSKIFDRVDVLWDGTTVLCCLDYEGKLVTGNLKDNSISYSWLGPKAMALRKKILKGEWMDLITCRQCLADHVIMECNNWRLTKPLSKLSFGCGKLLEGIEQLGHFDENTEKWKKLRNPRIK